MNNQRIVNLLADVPCMDVEGAVEAVGGSEAIYEKLIRQVVRLIPSHIEQMDKALGDDGDLAAFAIRIHGVKGSLSQSGCRSLAKQAEALEKAAKAGQEQFCAEHYGDFKTELTALSEQIKTIMQSVETVGASAEICSITDYLDDLVRARDAAEDCDSLLAAECLYPLTKRRFGGDADGLVARAAEALEVFQTQRALDNIVELLRGCGAAD